MNISYSEFTNEGMRSPNEDSVGAVSDGSFGIYVVADGLGGHIDGEIASRTAVELFLTECSADLELSKKALTDLFDMVNERVRDLNGPLTTAVCAFRKDDKLCFANVGDSRLYFFRDGIISAHTEDHSFAYLSYKLGEITYDEIRTNPGQSHLLKAVGSTAKSGVQIYPEITIQPGDAFLLCTDGFWELVYDDEIIADLAESKDTNEWTEKMLTRLRERLGPHSDNYTVLTGMITE